MMTAGTKIANVTSAGGRATRNECAGVNQNAVTKENVNTEGKPEQKSHTHKRSVKDRKKKIHHIDANESESEGTKSVSDSDLGLYAVSQKGKYSRISVVPKVNGKKMEMELDTGAAVSLIPFELYKRKLHKLPLQPTDIMLKTYTGEALAPEGVIKVQVALDKQQAVLPLYVVKVDAPPLFGREWLRAIQLNWRDLGTMKGVKVRLTLRPNSGIWLAPQAREMSLLPGVRGIPGPHHRRCWAPQVTGEGTRHHRRTGTRRSIEELLNKERKWQWTSACASAFQKAKALLVAQEVLTHFNPELPLRLACDASPYGVGAVLSHVMPDGEEKPIAYASRTLSKAEQNYAQIEREALAIVFGVRKFHQYLYGNTFTLLTDHRPLTTILSPVKSTPSMAAAHMQRWALLLSAHNYTIEYRKGALHANADGLSRLPLPHAPSEKQGAVEVFYTSQLDTLPVSNAEIKRHTISDSTLSRVMEMVTTGRFPTAKDAGDELSHYLQRRHELTVQHGCLMWGLRVIVPPKLRPRVLTELHSAHIGVVRMKSLARSYVWWPGIDSQIEHQAKSCDSCQRVQKDPGLAPLHPWMWPSSPWERIHVDFAGPFEGHMYLVVVDAHSKWPEIHIMDSTTSSKTIQVLRELFSRYGIPHSLVSDNGPQFCSEEFSTFLKANGVKHIRSAPYHLAFNGLAERFVQTFKHALRSSRGTTPLQQRLDTFLLTYRNTPHATTRESTAMLFIGRKLRSRLDFLKPSVARAVHQSQEDQQQRRWLHSKQRQFAVGEPVLVRDYRKGEDKWMPAVVIEKTGPVSYKVNVGTQGVWKRHVDQLLTRPESDPPETSESDHKEVEFELRRRRVSGTLWVGLGQSQLFGFWM
ncbi:hypothetical protein SRHO_G00243110 [Serrasalmus rhombeus]